jgi:type IV pilus assembly protein PilY1
MGWSYMPDELGNSGSAYTSWYGYWSPQCNGLAYDPNIVYLPPVTSTGASYANISFTSAPSDGFLSSSAKTDLSSRYYYSYNGNGGVKQPALNWQYTTSGTVSNTFYTECKLTSGSVFTKVLTSGMTTAQKQNYANWYSYYRKRYLVMRTGVGLAFSKLSDQYRVGFSTINYTGSTDGTEFLNIADFSAAQKASFFKTLYENQPSGSTPLRSALAKVGRYYGDKLSGQSVDPVQYQCQKNFAILSTDGYWNGSAGTDLNNSSIANQDGSSVDPSARPKYDGGAATLTNTTRWTTTQTVVTRTTSVKAGGDALTNKELKRKDCTSSGSGAAKRYTCVVEAKTDKKNHGLSDGDTVTIAGASPTGYNGSFTIDDADGDKFKYTVSNLTAELADKATKNVEGTTSKACSAALPSTRTVATTTTVTTTSNVQVQKIVNSIITSDVTTPSPSPATSTVTTQECVSGSTPISTVTSTVSDSGAVEVSGSRSTTSTSTTSGGSSGSLADVAFYYFNTDLRDTAWGNCVGALGSGTSVCGTADKFLKQNMVTFGIGLGVNGTLRFDKSYITQTAPGSGDFYDLKKGLKSWPVPSDGGNAENVDDLWHAAVNSTDFGTTALPVAKPNTQYFSAQDPSQLINSLNGALDTIKQIVGSASAAATSTLQPVTGDNDVFVAKFTSAKWYGDVERFSINPDTGAVTGEASWSAGVELDARDLVANPRKVYYQQSGSLKAFTYANLSADGWSSHLDGFCSKTGVAGSTPLQCSLISDKTEANKGSNLVAYLLGAANDNYRARDSRMGDIINGAPLFVGAPKFKYTENGYAGWATTTRRGECADSTPGNRKYQGTVYVGANDGMLHAFDRCDGSEKWAYVPSTVIPNLYKLADTGYANYHQFYVDGAPQTGDIFVNGAWKTIVVGGLNAGGRGYYALDVTDPDNPKALWEFTNSSDANLGLSFGNPIITKRADGTWVVVFASGYNNVSGGNGNGHLFVVNANTGVKLLSIETLASGAAVGTVATPSGLTKINAWIESEIDNTAKRFYGGDLLGNLWRFDIDNQVRPFGQSFRLAELTAGGTPQPITVKPELAEVNYLGAKFTVVYVGTGRYIGMTDLGTTATQSIYAIKDTLSETSLGDVRASNTLVAQTLTTNGRLRTATSNSLNWSTKNGWLVDLPSSGERINVNMVLAYNVLSVASTVPSVTACEIGGTSWLYRLDISNGAAVSNAASNAAGSMLEEGKLIVGQTVVQLTDGSATTISTLSDGLLRGDTQPPPAASNVIRRTSWRELIN